MKRTILLVSALTLSVSGKVANADFTFGTPTNLGSTINSTYNETVVCLSPDGLEMYFMSDRPGGSGDWDIWVSKRAATDGDWDFSENLGPTVNSPEFEGAAHISPDGLVLYFGSFRPRGQGTQDIWTTTRLSKNDPWAIPVNLGPPVNSPYHETCPAVTADGLELYFSSGTWPGGSGEKDIWVSTRPSVEEPWGEPANLGSVVNTAYMDDYIWLSPDGLLLVFDSDRPDGFGGYDLWITRRTSRGDPWTTPVNLGAAVNGPGLEALGALSADGRMLYFCSDRPGGTGGGWGDIWQAPILPIVDLNGDGIVDAADMCIMVDNWHTQNSLCDVAPAPLGDGFVDVQDLIILAEHLFEPFPPLEPVEVNESDDGGQVELKLGQTLVVTLESNPTTGYRWEQADDPESILKQIGEAEFKPSETGDPPLVGAGGWEILRFRASSAGQMTLQLVYRRPWEEGVEPLKTFSLQVVVR